MNDTQADDARPVLDRLMAVFFAAVSFRAGERPCYAQLHVLFIEGGLLIKNSTPVPEIATVDQFIAPRERMVDAGELTAFRERELAEITEVFGRVAHRFSTYEKCAALGGAESITRGMISTQFVAAPAGWRISAMAWDDERDGLSLPPRYTPGASG
jgi:hypothetical protein